MLEQSRFIINGHTSYGSCEEFSGFSYEFVLKFKGSYGLNNLNKFGRSLYCPCYYNMSFMELLVYKMLLVVNGISRYRSNTLHPNQIDL